ncbi:MAG: glycosyltransferase [Solirubrobacterales bacterium]|nr:glycosyltransferase [Solirubrobacterales bacterium]
MRPFVSVQAGLTALVLARLARGRNRRGPLAPLAGAPDATVSVVIPARDEADRIGPVLRALADDPAVHELIVVDDHSTDETARVAVNHGARVVLAPPLPTGCVGKPSALQHGLEQATGELVVTLDADVRPEPGLVVALADALLAAPACTLLTGTVRFDCRSLGERFLHPAFLASLVYRFGPGDVDGFQPRPSRAVANGQCLAARREELLAAGGFALSAEHMTDDVALARALRRRGWELLTVDVSDLLEVRMYTSAAETWTGWSRSLMAPDVTAAPWLALDVATLWAVQALPLPRLLARRGSRLDLGLLVLRLALHGAFRRTYRDHGAAFWLAPLADLPAVARLTWSVLRADRRWRGRRY